MGSGSEVVELFLEDLCVMASECREDLDEGLSGTEGSVREARVEEAGDGAGSDSVAVEEDCDGLVVWEVRDDWA